MKAKTAVKPRGCKVVCSPFGSRNSCDGSARSSKYPIHSGIDIAVAEGSPIVAVGDGVVVKSGKVGASVGGIGLVLMHPPEATGTASYTFSVYKHLRSTPPLAKGTRVSKGQRVASSGKSGTLGRNYGSRGFPHLHFEILTGGSDNYRNAKRINPVRFLSSTGSRTTWPLACK